MAFSYIEYTANGSTTTFSIPFAYTAQADVAVFVNGVSTSFTFASSSTITLSTAPASGVVVRIARTTPITTRAVDFSNGAILTESDLDNSNIQVFQAAQEAIDTAASSIFKTADGKFDAQSRVIKNVADPVSAQDAVTKTWAETASTSQLSQATAQAVISTTKASESSASATASEASKVASAASATTGAASAATATTQAALATTNGAAQVTLATAQKTIATTKASEASASATASEASKVSSASSATSATASAATATTQAALATTNGAAQVALATTQAGFATTNGAAQVTLATAQKTIATTKASESAASATASANSATAAATSASNASSTLSNAIVRDAATGAASMPTGTTAQRPSGAVGMFRHNSTLNKFEGYNDGAWGELGGGGPSLGTDSIIRTNANTISENITIPANTNGMSAGPITIANGNTVTVTGTWSIV